MNVNIISDESVTLTIHKEPQEMSLASSRNRPVKEISLAESTQNLDCWIHCDALNWPTDTAFVLFL